MKRLLCLLSCMDAGGAETFLMKIYRALDKSQYQMDFCINKEEKGLHEDEIVALGGKIYRIPSKSANMREFRRRLSAIVKEQGYRSVLRITSNSAGFIDLKIAKKAGATLCAARSSNSSDGGGIKKRVVHRLGRLFYEKYVDVKIAPSDLAAKHTFGKRAYESGEVALLRNALDVDAFRFNEDARRRIREELGIDANAKVVGHVGRLTRQKNHAFLLDVFKELVVADPSAILTLVGKGVLENEIKEKARTLGILDKVVFAGVRSDVPDVLSAFDVFLFPSLYEGMPNTALEAQANGLRCVVADTITREANITGLIEYLSLNASPKEWAAKVAAIDGRRVDTKEAFVRNGYEIKAAADEFARLLL